MPLVDLVMPKMGESIMEATILKWHKQPGDAVKQDETVLEIATDKVDSEVPSSTEGVLEELLYQVNDVVPIGSVIARIRTNGTATAAAPAASAHTHAEAQEYSHAAAPEYNHAIAPEPGQPYAAAHTEPAATGHAGEYIATPPTAQPAPGGNRFYSPLVLNIAANEGVPLSELEKLPGTGNDGRVTKKDILQYVADRKAGGAGQDVHTGHAAQPLGAQPVAATTAPAYTPAKPAATHGSEPSATAIAHSTPATQLPSAPQTTISVYSGNVEIMEMDRMRRLIADHMVRSVHTSAHVTSFSEADVTNMVHWRENVKKDFEKTTNTKLTFTPLFIEAVIRCLKKYPLMNSSIDGDKIIIKKDINIGMATALPSGNLIVPVIRSADELNLTGLARQVNMLADNARQGKLKPEDTQGGTFTLSNVGTFGSLMGTPIINQPQVAILAVGAIKKRPVVLETPGGDAIVIRHMMYLSLSYDHRIIDGSLGATFCSAVARELENFPADRQL
ncbi:MAG TPA: dihydrolipoamide acetyltransferase family protein [Puia sp.]|nr:dihydrolipoamide acetyltransferase family protein [Puia sp.]